MRSEFERCWPWLEPAIARYGPTHDKSHIWQAIEQGEAQQAIAQRRSADRTEELQDRFQEVNGWLSGGDLEEIRRTTEKIEDWRDVRVAGAPRFAAVRDGCAHLTATKRAVVMTKEL